ncbi:tRNA (adenosine(37)-N6)-dimethylallyltransferase MiaA [Candidatus Woesebacteria bacterium RIFCSPLOWO2_01_FULL_39_61]|uniref:tRNA dimethylallyltransferase n=2 Tax=Microgenomates group TaxID=1794810 RepID=A0A0H4T5C5_9BACT|nr:tRNA delta(2)-isopentenylpyrophosphate transferase, tRNA dimethylallyltransferase [uncultured Microgenomates bacterium Rifle_16ft_4_minimus_37836]OGM25141.1 MAG: tRNA (adenosine(37)-N6)-dimethylallyltransferase MiaA [Candidatus Woesebacteria bacterium RIFCSPHIGHO2_01_FULL_39_95]OGM34021.1 MAG: tRNA (adenosine(37)-N6)-dimethylallyltransferase MiaA [Candidatus Woesebacteria bacterium RIFCSPHIGHO2_02_FULL_39_13]OGM38279.1 MAG: tRNA (adenosine(37)-N6)-dimethylallyltransferase MiaA [Candidatus Woe
MDAPTLNLRPKLLIVCGPTATGKTELALHLAEVLVSDSKIYSGVEIVSGDSRQVYKNMDIGTGKGLPKGAKYKISNLKFKNKTIGYYEIDRVKIWGYDLVNPKEAYSVSKYTEIADEILKNIWERRKLPILVGGTGLYIKSLVSGIETISIPQNKSLRRSLGKKSAPELFEILAQLDPVKAGSLNTSDSKNPRRLVRAIEIAQWKLKRIKRKKTYQKKNLDSVFIGLYAPKEMLEKRIQERIQERLKKGIEDEIKRLLKSGVYWEDQSMQSLAYKEWKGYFAGSKTKDEVIKNWENDEKNYVKRQMIWFKTNLNIHWFDITKPVYPNDVEKMVKEWYISK